MNIDTLKAALEREEGRKAKPYRCTEGRLTIGIGRNLDDVGLSDREIEFLLENDIQRVCEDLNKHIPWWVDLDDARQHVLVQMAFQMGIRGLLNFKTTLARIQAGNYDGAAESMLESLWARQTPARAQRMADMMRNGR